MHLRERAAAVIGKGDEGMEAEADHWEGDVGNGLEGRGGEFEVEERRGRGQNDGTTRFVWDHGVLA